MATLSREEIIKKIREGKIKIEPFDEKNVGPASIDLTLGEDFRIYKKSNSLEIKEDTDYMAYTEPRKGSITLNPGDFAIGVTKEKVSLPENLCGELSGRSRFARLGILVHATASLVQPGINNHQVLEIKNISPNKIILKAGLKICQLMVLQMQGKSKYSGKFSKQ